MESLAGELRELQAANRRLFTQLGEANAAKSRLETLLKGSGGDRDGGGDSSAELSAALRNLAHRDAALASLGAEKAFLERQNRDLQMQLRKAEKTAKSGGGGEKVAELRAKNATLVEMVRLAEANAAKALQASTSAVQA